MRVVVVGLGYVGSVCSACLASRGHSVVGVDVSESKVGQIEAGKSPIVEAGLGELIEEGHRSGRLTATTRIAEAMPGAEVVLICVGTPSHEDGSLNLDHVKGAAGEVGTALRGSGTFTTVVMRSTMLPGSVENELRPVLERTSGLVAGRDFGIACNPEFLREGTAVADFFGAEITVIGAGDPRSAAALSAMYQGVGGDVVVTAIRTAEMLKYVNNAFHALKVSFANEVGRWARREGVDSHEVMRLFCRDTRLNLSATYLRPGFAFGGSCLPKDLRALNQRTRHHDLELPVLGAVMRSNERHVEEAIHLIERLRRRRVGVLGLSFKAGTDDLRESPILRVVGTLVGKGYSLLLHDPNIDMERVLGANRRFVESEVPYLPERLRPSAREVVEGSEVVVVGNDSREYREVGALLKPGQALVDLVHGVDRKTVAHAEYHGLAW
ncbi:MAG: nucleotide sugar dehydrogenase [Candidatus Eisenbacteria bacterium]|uniref:UDP-glucose 6-dehydrogenase n=1 Tax=Eiseniibacteriota bacterium TaxID=2212470 RepID=A0A538SWE9_UNCEI|nr:MAG: nucleotide sugar dehydrogenase [Candidatus Eisenbacteria bacterium]